MQRWEHSQEPRTEEGFEASRGPEREGGLPSTAPDPGMGSSRLWTWDPLSCGPGIQGWVGAEAQAVWSEVFPTRPPGGLVDHYRDMLLHVLSHTRSKEEAWLGVGLNPFKIGNLAQSGHRKAIKSIRPEREARPLVLLGSKGRLEEAGSGSGY